MNDRLDISEIFLKGPKNPNKKVYLSYYETRTIQSILLKLYTVIEEIERKYIVQSF